MSGSDDMPSNMERGDGDFALPGVCPPAGHADDDERNGTGGFGRASLRSDAASYRPGKPMCWYGAACRKMGDPTHCEKYDHELRPCKFGAKCRRQGRGCKYQHPGPGERNEALMRNAGNSASRRQGRNARGNSNSNSNGNSNLIETNEEPEPARPVPFVFFLLCICALGLVVLPILGECDPDMHSSMFKLGLALAVPFVVFEVVLFSRRSWVLNCFLEGDYSEKAVYSPLGCLWYPAKVQLIRYTTGDLAGNNIEQYATWETNDVQQTVEAALGNRDGGQVRRGSIAGQSSNQRGFEFDFPGEFGGDGVSLDAQGSLHGLGVLASFDGSNIVSCDGAWTKAGYWRLDFVTKVLILLFVVGMECAFVATLMPPGVAGFGGLQGHKRMPLNAVFVVDGSASIEPDMWKAQQRAGAEFIKAFERTYGDHGDLNIGIVQFSTDARIEEPLTSDIDTVLNKFHTMQQMEKLTYFDKGLSLCSSSLNTYDAEHTSFDVCVLITDGIDMSKKTSAALQGLLPTDAAIFGIFVGNDKGGMRLLQDTTECGLAKSPKHGCDFFASASDYATLSARASEVASEVVRGVDVAMCALMTALIGVPTALGMCLPYILWYVSCTGLTMWRRRTDSNNYRPLKNNNFSNMN